MRAGLGIKFDLRAPNDKMQARLHLLFFGVVCFSALAAVCAVTISDTASPPVRSISEVDRAALPVNDTDGLPCVPFSGAVDPRNRVAIIGVRCQNGTVVGRIPDNETVVVVRSQIWVVNMTTDPATVLLTRVFGQDTFGSFFGSSVHFFGLLPAQCRIFRSLFSLLTLKWHFPLFKFVRYFVSRFV
jgi:hypothetical protein